LHNAPLLFQAINLLFREMEKCFNEAYEHHPHFQVASLTSKNHGQTCEQYHELRGQLHKNEINWTDEGKKEYFEENLTTSVPPNLCWLVHALK
jgi:hypothetical protein